MPWPFKWGEWQPASSTSPVLSQDRIRARAHLLSKIHPWQSPDENWTQAERELSLPEPSRTRVAFWRWCGFSEKKGWDWLDFLARLSVPVVIAVGGWYLSSQSASQQLRISQSNQKDSIVSDYIKSMNILVLDKGLNEASPTDPISGIARTLTLTSLSRVWADNDGLSRHKAEILQFLFEARLINVKKPIISLAKANLSEANLSGVSLSGVNLSGANLRGANLSKANLRGANLDKANLHGANLSVAILTGATFKYGDLREADFSSSDLRGANFYTSYLQDANLDKSLLNGAHFNFAMLCGATFRDSEGRNSASFDGAYFDKTTILPSPLPDKLIRGDCFLPWGQAAW